VRASTATVWGSAVERQAPFSGQDFTINYLSRNTASTSLSSISPVSTKPKLVYSLRAASFSGAYEMQTAFTRSSPRNISVITFIAARPYPRP